MPPGANDEARERLRRAMALHSAGEIDAALTTAREAITLAPDLAEAHGYLGNTLVTRRRAFADGLAALTRATELAPDDPAIRYTLGWCQEFVANALARPRARERSQPPRESADELYAAARATMLRALELQPDDALRGDIEDILDVVAAVTGEPWDLEEHPRVAPRPR